MIPSSLTIESPDQRIKTYKVGQIARAASIFGVDKIIIYKDGEFDDSRFISLVLRYIETPQYLRKRLFPLKEELRYVGVVPPLRTPHHPLNSKSYSLLIGEFREGAVVELKKGMALIDIGVEIFAKLRSHKKSQRGDRLTLKIISTDPLEVEYVEEEKPPSYWGYETEIAGTLGETLARLTSEKVVFTSRGGEVVSGEKMEELVGCDIVFIFGSPHRGVEAILSDEGLSTKGFTGDVLNTIPSQGTETIRTEEAVFATLAVYNVKKIKIEGALGLRPMP